ncbi:MAG: hypothetical protein ACK5CW_09285 [Verrucomicrobiota bacterium]|jgi:hypothetical protein
MTDSPSGPSSQPRIIRSFARRDDAERARDLLAEHEITASLQEFWMADPKTGVREMRGCALQVPPEMASDAARLLLRMPPSEAPGRPATQSADSAAAPRKSSGSRLRRRTPEAQKKSGSIFMIGVAVLGAALFLLYAGNALLGPKQRRAPADDEAETYTIDEDLNGDSIADTFREYTALGRPVSWQEDRNFDGTIDIRWIWQRQKIAYRDRDLDGDGRWDERTTFDPEGLPFYTDLRPGGSGPIRTRRIFRDGILWRTLEDLNADTQFDTVTDTDEGGDILRREPLPPNAPENATPQYPLPPLPLPDPEQMSAPLKALPPANP